MPVRLAPSLLAAVVAIVLGGVPVSAQVASAQVVAAPEARTTPADTSLAAFVDRLVAREDVANAIWGIAVVEVESGRVRVQRNAGKTFVPASNQKLLTTAAALDALGPGFRYTTRLYAHGPLDDDGVLRGPLAIRGAGDPTLGGYAQREDPTAVFRAWADSLRARGIRRVAGDVIGDDDVFDDVALGLGWTWDDASYGYAAEIGGLVFGQSQVRLRAEARRRGEPARLTWTPATDYVTVVNRTRTLPVGERIDEDYVREPGTNTLVVASAVPEGAVEREALTVANPTRYAAFVLREALIEQGVGVQGRAVDVDDLALRPAYPPAAPATPTAAPPADATAAAADTTTADPAGRDAAGRDAAGRDTTSVVATGAVATSGVEGTDADEAVGWRPVATYVSPRLDAIARVMNHESLNLYAEQLLRTVGALRPVPEETSLTPGSAAMGAAVVKRLLARAGANTARVRLADGSGLSRMNGVTPDALTALLRYMARHPNAAVARAFRASLPLGGRDGTLKYRFRGDAPARERVRAKTGTLTGVNALAGYVTTRAGTELAFAILCNHHTTRSRTIRRLEDALVNRLAAQTE